MFNGKIHYTWPFSIAMLVITRGYLQNIHLMRTSRHILPDVLWLNGVESSGDIWWLEMLAWFMIIRTGFVEQGLVQYHRNLVYPRKSNLYTVHDYPRFFKERWDFPGLACHVKWPALRVTTVTRSNVRMWWKIPRGTPEALRSSVGMGPPVDSVQLVYKWLNNSMVYGRYFTN